MTGDGMLWLTVAVIGGATMAIKAAGPVVLGGRPLPRGVVGIVSLLAPALLAALVATLTLGMDQRLVVDARILGVGAAAILIWLRAPILVAVVTAAGVTAAARALGLS